MKDRCIPASCVDVRNDGNTSLSGDNHKETFEVQNTSASHEECLEGASEHHLYHLGDYTEDVEMKSSVLLEGFNNSWDEIAPREMTLVQEQRISHLPDELSLDTQTIVKEDPLQSDVLVLKYEQECESNELTQIFPQDNIHYMEKVEAPAYVEQNLREYSTEDKTNDLASLQHGSGGESVGAASVAAGNPHSRARRVPSVRARPLTVKRPFLCEICGASFACASKFKKHERVHTGERPFKCDFCGNCFSEQSNFLVHRRKHTGERPYRCDVCEMCFARQGNLIKHKRKHTGERPYQCNVCGVCFADSCTLVAHKRRHTGERPYRCDVCGNCFAQRGGLLVHKRQHTGERPCRCDVCGNCFIDRSALLRHKRKHTGEQQ